MVLKALPEKRVFSFVPVPTGACNPFLAGLLGAGLHNPSSVYIQISPWAETWGKIFVVAQVLLNLWELSLK